MEIKFTLTLCDKRDLKQTATATRTWKNERYNGRQFKVNMESCEPADEEELPTFSLGMEFLTPQKERKGKENKEQALLVSYPFRKPSGWKCYKTIGSYVTVRPSRYEARGNFGEHERCVRVAQSSEMYKRTCWAIVLPIISFVFPCPRCRRRRRRALIKVSLNAQSLLFRVNFISTMWWQVIDK